MKKITIFTLLFLLTLALAACGGKDEPMPTESAPAEVAPEEETMPETEVEESAAEEVVEEAVEEPVSEEEAAVEEVTVELSPLAALAAQNIGVFTEAYGTCPPRTFPIPDSGSNAKRPLDFTPFTAAMDAFTPEQTAVMDAALADATLPEIQEMMDNGDFTSEHLLLYYLNRIQQYDVDKLNSVMELNSDALTIAQSLDAERASGTVRGNMHGIPVLLKDNIGTAAPLHTTAGNYALKDWQPDRDAFLVQQLREAGAIILGKNNLSEWANYTDPCMPSGYTSVGGQTRHPYGPYDPLGSSSGSGVSVGANLIPVSVGSETAGSLTQPARSSGAVALRPSQGLISGDYIIPLESHLDTAGPMGRSVTDVAVLLTAMAGVDENDPKTADAATLSGTDFTEFLSLEEAQKVKVGVVQFDMTGFRTFLGNGGTISEEEIENLTPEEWQQFSDLHAGLYPARATQEMIDALKNQGIEVVIIKESELPPYIVNTEVGLLNFGFQNSTNAFFSNLGDVAPLASLAEAMDIVNEDPANRAPYGQRYVEWSVNTETTAEEYETAVNEGQNLHAAWMQWFKDTHDVDVILMGMLYTNAGLANVPALTIPTGQSPDANGQPGQPTGVLISGQYLSDGQVLAVGYALEQALDVHIQPDLDATIQQIEAVTGQ